MCNSIVLICRIEFPVFIFPLVLVTCVYMERLYYSNQEASILKTDCIIDEVLLIIEKNVVWNLKINAVSSPPPASSLSIESPTSSHPSPALLFFLGGIVLLLTLLILIFVFRKVIKPAKLRALVARSVHQPGYIFDE